MTRIILAFEVFITAIRDIIRGGFFGGSSSHAGVFVGGSTFGPSHVGDAFGFRCAATRKK